MVDQVIAERFDTVLTKGRALLPGPIGAATGRAKIDTVRFAEWRTQTLALLNTVFGPTSSYTTDFEQTTKNEKTLSPAPVFVEMGMGTLVAAAEDVARGWTWTFKERVHAAIFDDFLEMADSLLDDGYKDAAAMIAGGVLEEHMRKLCQKNGIAIEKADGRKPERKTMAPMNDELHKHGSYNQAEWRSVQVWIDHRNDAAHGDYGKYDQKQIKLMISGIRDFVVRHPA